jgi:hypothetical protein
MEHNNVSRQDNQANDSVSARRKFLIKTSTGLGATTVMAALPIKSAWATGVVNSIVASGNGSDFANRRTGMDVNFLSVQQLQSLNLDPTSYVGYESEINTINAYTSPMIPTDAEMRAAFVLNQLLDGSNGINYPVVDLSADPSFTVAVFEDKIANASAMDIQMAYDALTA